MGLKGVASQPAGSAGGGTAGPTPATSTDNAIVRWDGTGGRTLQDSVVTVADTTGLMTWPGPAIFGASAAAAFKFGGADAAAPVAQSLAVQSVVTGTSNIAGAAFTFMGSQGTGTGAGGSILFQTAAASTTGSTPNALATALTINSDGQTLYPVGTAALPSISFAGDVNNGFWAPAADRVGYSSNGATVVRFQSTAFQLGSGMIFQWSSAVDANAGTADTFASRKGAANVRFGVADAASPVAQTTSVQGVVAGTANTAGAAWTFQGSQSTGQGAGGSIIFQTSPAAVGSASTQNAFATALAINSDGQGLFSVGTAALPSLSFILDPDTGFWNRTANTVSLNAGGNTVAELVVSQFRVGNAIQLGFSSASGAGSNADTIMTRKGAANLRYGAADVASPVAQTISVQSVVAGTTDTAGTALTVTGSQGTGTGAGGSIVFQTAPAAVGSASTQNTLTTALTLTSNGSMVMKVSTVANLPSASTEGQGARRVVSDALTPIFGNAVTGGGAVTVGVISNATAWLVG